MYRLCDDGWLAGWLQGRGSSVVATDRILSKLKKYEELPQYQVNI